MPLGPDDKIDQMAARRGFVVEQTPVGRELVLTGPWTDSAGARLRSGTVQRLPSRPTSTRSMPRRR